MRTRWHFLVGAMAVSALITATPALAEDTPNPTSPPVESQPAPVQPPTMIGPDDRGTFHPPEDFKQREPEKPFENFQPKEGQKNFDNRMNQPMMDRPADRQMKGPEGEMQGPDSDKMAEQQNRQMVQNAQQQIKGLEKGIKQFESQIKMLTTKKVSVPAEVTETLAKIKAVIVAVKAAKTADELTAAGWENLSDEMDTLREKQEMLQHLSRWPQTLKQVDRMLSNHTRQLTKAKAVVDRLRARGIDMTALYTELETSVGELKTVRAEAIANVAAGKIEDAQNALEDRFFGGDDDMMEKQRIIQTMSNIGRFPAEYKRGKKEMDRTVAKLKKQKADMTEIDPLVARVTAKGEEVLQLIKVAKPDAEAIMDALQDLEDARQDFMEAVQSALGQSDEMPWEQKQPAGTHLSFALPKFAKPAPATMLALQN